MVLDFAAIPPEINSALMYSGAGSGPLMAAARLEQPGRGIEHHGDLLGVDHHHLTTEQWRVPGRRRAAAAAAPYVAWLGTTAAALEHAGVQAAASAAAYEAALRHGVPLRSSLPTELQLSALVATNFLGINTPAIVATEAQYAEMWVQDATAMYTYAAAATSAAALQPLTPASPTTSPVAAATQAAAVTRGHAAAADFHPALGCIA